MTVYRAKGSLQCDRYKPTGLYSVGKLAVGRTDYLPSAVFRVVSVPIKRYFWRLSTLLEKKRYLHGEEKKKNDLLSLNNSRGRQVEDGGGVPVIALPPRTRNTRDSRHRVHGRLGFDFHRRRRRKLRLTPSLNTSLIYTRSVHHRIVCR